MAYQLQNSIGVPRGLAADDTVLGSQIFESGRICALGAELLDSRGKAM
jgi:hypothetical protein